MVAPGLLLLSLILLGASALYFWSFLRVFGRSRRSVIFSAVIFAILGFLAPLLIGVWLPDCFSSRVREIASARLPDGTDFRVTQYCDGCPDYMTELWVTHTDGRRERQTLDGDDHKSWHIPLSVDAATRTVTVVLSGNREKRVSW